MRLASDAALLAGHHTVRQGGAGAERLQVHAGDQQFDLSQQLQALRAEVEYLREVVRRAGGSGARVKLSFETKQKDIRKSRRKHSRSATPKASQRRAKGGFKFDSPPKDHVSFATQEHAK